MNVIKRVGLGLTLFLCLSACSASFVTRQIVHVDHVIDGDTVRLDSGESVRLIGINAPELRHDTRSAEPYARQAKDRLAQLVEDRKIQLVPGVERRDRYKRLLATIKLTDGQDVQKILLKEGLAFAIAVPPDIKHADEYLASENLARKAGLGLWAKLDHLFVKTADIKNSDKGRFRLVKGKISRVVRSKHNIYLKFGKAFSVRIPQKLWRENWRGDPGRLRGKTVEVRGWVGTDKYGYRIPVRHPVMIQINSPTS